MFTSEDGLYPPVIASSDERAKLWVYEQRGILLCISVGPVVSVVAPTVVVAAINQEFDCTCFATSSYEGDCPETYYYFALCGANVENLKLFLEIQAEKFKKLLISVDKIV